MNSLALLDPSQLPGTSLGSAQDFAAVSAGGGGFLVRLVFAAKPKTYANGTKTQNSGTFYIPETASDFTDLGNRIDIVPLARRTKALDMRSEKPIAYYDRDSAEFKEVEALAKSKQKNTKCLCGPSILVIERTTGRILELYFGTKSSAPEAKYIWPYMAISEAEAAVLGCEPHGYRPCTLTSRFIDGEFPYHVPVVQDCSTPFANLPELSVIHAEMTKFLNPADVVEVVDDDAETARDR